MIHRPFLREQKLQPVDTKQMMLALVRLWTEETDPKAKSLYAAALRAAKQGCKITEENARKAKKKANTAKHNERVEMIKEKQKRDYDASYQAATASRKS